ncbi:hypothetical protein [Halpernia sp.]|uniref:hypothetical protein n=1 Tax=Halpernia sp. TaxID=2782209 RepID=UPI003A8E0C42
MKTVSLKIDNSIFEESEKILTNINISRNRYINDAIEHYNKVQKRKYLEKRLKIESIMIREDSMKINKEFENIDYAN